MKTLYRIMIPDYDFSHISNLTIQNNLCCIVVPIYKQHLTQSEQQSLYQLSNIIQDKYQIILVTPESLDLSEYRNYLKTNFGVLEISRNHSSSIFQYNNICLDTRFYSAFENYKFILIYLLDGYIFYDNIEHFCMLDYDYIGSPWTNMKVGNGGVSLRKISKFIEESKTMIKIRMYEDYLWSDNKNLNIAPVDIAAQFCIGLHPEVFTNILVNNTPMCLHYFNKDEIKQYWKPFI